VVDEAHLLDNHQLEAIRLLTLCRAKTATVVNTATEASTTFPPSQIPLSHRRGRALRAAAGVDWPNHNTSKSIDTAKDIVHPAITGDPDECHRPLAG
jgi:hypothetical protein